MACIPVEKIPVWRERAAVLAEDGKTFEEAKEGPFMWVGRCLCDVASQGVDPEKAQAATAEACELKRRYEADLAKIPDHFSYDILEKHEDILIEIRRALGWALDYMGVPCYSIRNRQHPPRNNGHRPVPVEDIAAVQALNPKKMIGPMGVFYIGFADAPVGE